MSVGTPAKRRMSRATWIGLGMGVALLLALAWLLGWGADPAPPVPQLGGAPLSDLYPEWVRPGGGGLPLPPMLNVPAAAPLLLPLLASAMFSLRIRYAGWPPSQPPRRTLR